MDQTTHEEIALVEARIEDLQQAIERCRKLALVARLTIGAGAIWIVLTLLGLMTFYPGAMVAALAATIGSIVILGSNSTTWMQTEAKLRDSEALRAELIGSLEMRLVDTGAKRLH